MRGLHCFPFVARLLWAVVVDAASIPSPSALILPPDTVPHNASALQAPISNLTHPGDPVDPVDPFFGFTPYFQGRYLDENATVLNSIDVALQLALGDIDAKISESYCILDSHPSVQIAILPDKSEDFGRIPRRWAVWGLNIGIDLMIRTQRFQSAVFVLTMAGKTVAIIEYSVARKRVAAADDGWNVTGEVPTLGNATSLPFNRTIWLEDDLVNDTSVAGIINSDAGSMLRVGYHLSGRVLSKYQICYAALDALRAMSAWNRKARVHDSTLPLLSADLILFTVDASSPPRTGYNPPFFQAQWIMRAVAQMPGFMMRQGVFLEVSMEVWIGRTLIGWVLSKSDGASMRPAQTS